MNMNGFYKSGIAFLVAFWLCIVSAAIAGISMGEEQSFEKTGPGKSGYLTILYPREQTLFPADIAAPTFRWKDSSGASAWRITVRFKDRQHSLTAESSVPQWRPTREEWEQIRKFSMEKGALVTVSGTRAANKPKGADIVSLATVTIKTSSDPVLAPIFYREVRLPVMAAMKNLRSARWRLGYVSSYEQPGVLLQGMNICANCHSVSRDGKTLGMDVDVDSDKGAYVIADIGKEVLFSRDRVITWNAFMREGQKHNFGFLSQFSPDGRYVISTIRELPVYYLFPDPGNPQLFFPVRGILAVYDRKTGTFSMLPGADDSRYVQTNPVWSPDGKWIIFARAMALNENPDIKSFVSRKALFRYDLYRIPFNDGKGGKAEPVAGASGNGRSNYFPRFTPDGRWLIYTQSDSYMLNQPDAELHIIPAEGGKSRKMVCNTPGKMSSWHSVSPNGRWMVFSSKANGPYTGLWLTHLDKDGNDTPPVQLEDFIGVNMAANLPEFVDIRPGTLIRINNRLE